MYQDEVVIYPTEFINSLDLLGMPIILQRIINQPRFQWHQLFGEKVDEQH